MTKPIQIGLIGLIGSGKSTFLAVLPLAMQQLGWKIFGADQHTHNRLLKDFNEMVMDGSYPSPTVDSEGDKYFFHVQQPLSNNWISRFLSNNKPGFDVEISVLPENYFGGIVDELLVRKFMSSDALLFLIDPEERHLNSTSLSFNIILTDILGNIQRYRTQREIFVAFCVTKMDLFPSAWFDVEQFAREIVFRNQKTILSQLDNFCDPAQKVFCRWFACSNIGFINDTIAEGQSRHFFKDDISYIEDSGNLTPLGIGEALEWLLLKSDKKGQAKLDRDKTKEDIYVSLPVVQQSLEQRYEMKDDQSQIQIFLCHANEDKNQVQEVYKKLKQVGLKPWLDKEDLLPGQVWQDEIRKAINASTFILIFFSNTSISKRGYVQKEFKLALDVLDEIPEGQIFIIPVRLDNCQLPGRFSQLHYCDLFESDGFGKILRAITEGSKQLK